MHSEQVAFGFDVGTRWIGVAVGSSLGHKSKDLGIITLKANRPSWQDLDQWVKLWSPNIFVVGYPLTDGGKKQPMTGRSRVFAQMISDRYQRPYTFEDERFSTCEARITKDKKNKKNINALAACIILDQWIKRHKT